MKQSGTLEPDPTKIGNIAKPPFVRLPEPRDIFVRRARRFAALAEGHDLAPYLRLLAAIAEIQSRLAEEVPAPQSPIAETLSRASEFAMPPLDRNGFVFDGDFGYLVDRLAEAATAIEMPGEARAALARVAVAGRAERERMARNVLSDAIPVEAIAEHAFMAAALQVRFAMLAAQLDAGTLAPVGDGVCPACGGAPSASLIVGWLNAEGTRFCACSTCATLWNVVRSKCVVCSSTRDIAFQEVEGVGWNVKAETCGACRSYVKLMYQTREPQLDPVADDVATLGLDMLVKELGFRRGAVNPFLIGY